MDSGNVTPISGKLLAKRHTGSLPNLLAAQERLQPAPIAETVAALATCLALVRPVGMAQGDADEWLRVASREVSHLPPDVLADGCAQARKTCTHHGQIVPTIIKHTDEWMATRRKLAARPEAPAEPVALLEVEKPTPDDFRELLANLDHLNVGKRSGSP